MRLRGCKRKKSSLSVMSYRKIISINVAIVYSIYLLLLVRGPLASSNLGLIIQ
jgi:hypothetical protein